MSFHSSKIFLSGVLVVCTSVAAEAMTLVVKQAGVLVNHGEGFIAVSDQTPVAPGASILVNAGGQAELVCADGMSLSFVDPGYYTAPASCATGQTQSMVESLGAAGPLLIGGAALGGAIAIIEGTASNNDRPASN
jgi:hypothetical protein